MEAANGTIPVCAHNEAVQALMEQHPDATILSIDGVGAFDLISRESNVEHAMPRRELCHPFRADVPWPSRVRICGRMILEKHTASTKGRERTGRPPHASLVFPCPAFSSRNVDSRLQEDDRLMAFLDDVYVVNPRPDTVLHSYTALEDELWTHASIRINGGKARVWNRSGSQPHGCDVLQRIGSPVGPGMLSCGEVQTWPTVQQGIKILGTPLGKPR